MRKASVILVLCALAATAPLAGCQKVKARAELKKGNKFYKEENYKLALEQFQRALQLDPNADFAWRSVGLTAMALFKPGDESSANKKYADLAVDAFQRYMKAQPADTKTQEYLMNVWVSANRFDQAINFLKQERQAHAGDTSYDKKIVAVMIKANRFQDAFQWVNDKTPRDANLYYQISTQAWSKSYNDPTTSFEDRIKFVDLGIQAAQRAVDVKPDYMEAMVYYGLLLREKVKLTLDEKQKADFTAQANLWRDKAMALKNKGKTPTPTPATSAAATTKTS